MFIRGEGRDITTPIGVFPSDWLSIFHPRARLVCSSSSAVTVNWRPPPPGCGGGGGRVKGVTGGGRGGVAYQLPLAGCLSMFRREERSLAAKTGSTIQSKRFNGRTLSEQESIHSNSGGEAADMHTMDTAPPPDSSTGPRTIEQQLRSKAKKRILVFDEWRRSISIHRPLPARFLSHL